MKDVIKFLQSIINIPDQLVPLLLEYLVEEDIKKKKKLIRPNQVCKKVYFILKGIFRVYHLEDGIERTDWLLNEGHVMYCVDSFNSGEVTGEGIEALTDGKVVYITKAQLEDLQARSSEFLKLEIRLNRKYRILGTANDKIRAAVYAETRHARFLKCYPQLAEKVPKKHLASFLRIDPSHYSRMLKEQKKKE